jgi:hypothetical protein
MRESHFCACVCSRTMYIMCLAGFVSCLKVMTFDGSSLWDTSWAYILASILTVNMYALRITIGMIFMSRVRPSLFGRDR